MLQKPAEKGAKRMRVMSIMAAILDDELREHGVLGLTQLDCETIVRSMIERTAGGYQIKSVEPATRVLVEKEPRSLVLMAWLRALEKNR
jgi:hypothetical protein